MASNSCPACTSQASPTFLVLTSSDAYVDYYCCPDCHHVWATTKSDRAFLRHVTPLPEQSPYKLP
jgi:hypothetical protein